MKKFWVRAAISARFFTLIFIGENIMYLTNKKNFLVALLLLALTACKKEELVTGRGLNLDLDKYTKLTFDFKGRIRTSSAMRAEWKLLCNKTEPIWLNSTGGSPILYIPSGWDTLQLMDMKTGHVDFTGEFNIADSADALTFFQIDSSFRPVVVRNDQGNVPLPPENVIKMKIANFCSELGTDPIDLVVRQYTIFWEVLRTDTIYNIMPGFSGDYFSLERVKYTNDWGEEAFADPYVTFCKSSDKSPILLKQQSIPGYDIGIYLYGAGRVTTTYIYGTYKEETGEVTEIIPLFEN